MDGTIPLVPELQAAVRPSRLGPIVHHPLVVSVPYSPILNEYLNKVFAMKTQRVAASLAARDWHQYIWWHERPYRLDIFLTIMGRLDGATYWNLLGDIWTDTETIYVNRRVWMTLLTSSQPDRQAIMSAEEQSIFAALPDKVMVYRGYVPGKNKRGLSWTLSEVKARWFADRFGQGGAVCQRIVRRSAILAYFNRRGEDEVVVR